MARQRPINVEIRSPGGPIWTKQYGCFSRVRAIRKDVEPCFRATDLFVIIILGHSVDNDEYLVDLGCLLEKTSTAPIAAWRTAPIPEQNENLTTSLAEQTQHHSGATS